MHVFLESYSMTTFLYFTEWYYGHFLILKIINKLGIYTLQVLLVYNSTLEMQAKGKGDGKWSLSLLNLMDNALTELNFALWVNTDFDL